MNVKGVVMMQVWDIDETFLGFDLSSDGNGQVVIFHQR